jgi:hypothetical protein
MMNDGQERNRNIQNQIDKVRVYSQESASPSKGFEDAAGGGPSWRGATLMGR